MALYSDFHYAIYSEYVLGYLAMFVACLALISVHPSYSSCILLVHPKGGGPGGARVVTSYAGMVPGYADP